MIYVLLPESICFDAIADYVDSKKKYFYVQKTHFSEKNILTTAKWGNGNEQKVGNERGFKIEWSHDLKYVVVMR